MNLRLRLVAAFCLATAASVHAAPPRYALQSLGEYWIGVGFNSANQFAGNDTMYDFGMIYEAGEVRGLSTRRGRTIAAGINRYGAVAGTDVDAAGISRATLWNIYYEPQDLGVLPGGTFSFAAGINDAGQVVGASSYDAEANRTFAVSWKNGKMKNLGSLPGSDNSGARAVNAKGQVVGWASTPVTRYKHAVRWTDGHIEDLGFLPGGTNEYSFASAINRRGDVVGGAVASDGAMHPFLIRAGIDAAMKDLGLLLGGGSESCQATGINAAREVIGWCHDWIALKDTAFIYRGGHLQALDKFLDSSGSGWKVYMARSIDDQGRILGEAYDPEGHWHPVLLTPAGVEQR